MKTLNQIKQNSYQKTIIYGASKTGKTRMIGRLAKTHKLLWFDTENGINTLLDPTNLDKEYLSNITYIKLPDSFEEPLAAQALMKVFSFKETKICDTHGIVDCPTCLKEKAEFTTVDLKKLPEGTIVVVDSLAQLVNSWMNHIARGKPEGYKFQFDDWALLGVYGKKFLTNIQVSPINIIITSREMEVIMEDGRKILVPNGGTRNFSCDVPGYFDHVVYTNMVGKKHAQGSSTTYTTQAMAGSRTNALVESDAASKMYTPLETIYKQTV